MDLKSLAKKIDQKIAQSSPLDLAIQELDAEIGQMAIDCVRRSKNASVKNANNIASQIAAKIKEIVSRPYENVLPISAATAVGGAGLGALLGGNLVSKDEAESTKDFNQRKRDTALTAALAGGALGGGLPSILNNFGLLGSRPPGVIESAVDAVKDQSGRAAFIGGGAAAGQIAKSKLESMKANRALAEAQTLKEKAKTLKELNLQNSGAFRGLQQQAVPDILLREGPDGVLSPVLANSASSRLRNLLGKSKAYLPALGGGLLGEILYQKFN